MKKILLLLITVCSLSAVAQEKWNLNVRPRVNFSNASFKNTITNYSSKLNADAAFGLGVEVESVLNINKNKKHNRSFIQHYKSETMFFNNLSNSRSCFIQSSRI